MNCLTQTVVLFSALSTDGWGGRGGGTIFFFLHSSRILIGRCRQLLEPHWPPAPSLLDLLSPLPAPFGVHAQDKQARNRLETVWSLSEIDKIGDGVFYISLHIYERAACWNWDFFVFLPSSSSSSKTTSPTSRHAEPEEYLFFFNHKRCESFFSCSLSADRLFMHRQVRQAPEWELDAAALHISLKNNNQIMRWFVCVFNEEENKTTSELIIKIILNVVSSCSDVHRWISPTVACVFIISCGFSRVSYIVLEAWPHSHYFRRMRRWRTFADVRLLINPTRA